MRQPAADVAGVEGRLADAAAAGERLEVILVLRGRVRRVGSTGGWRMRLDGGRVLTFRPDAVVAVTPLAGPSRR